MTLPTTSPLASLPEVTAAGDVGRLVPRVGVPSPATHGQMLRRSTAIGFPLTSALAQP